MLNLHDITDERLQAGSKGAEPTEVDADIYRRALMAFLKSAKGQGVPEAIGINHSGKLYVALHDDAGVGSVYRVRNDLQLKRMRRIPEPVAYIAELERRAAPNRRRKYA